MVQVIGGVGRRLQRERIDCDGFFAKRNLARSPTVPSDWQHNRDTYLTTSLSARLVRLPL